jgi:death on curing protein
VTEITWLSEAVVVALHEAQLNEHGGSTGIRDYGLLQSALARPQQLHSYGESPGIVDLTAAYIVGIVKNHPFIDGNKRVGFISGVAFLERNGFRFAASEEDAVAIILTLAAGELDEAGLVSFLHENSTKIC